MYERESAALKKDLPVLEEVINGSWGKEEELKNLKLELSTLERRIKLSLESQNEPANTENVKKVKREENAVAVLPEPKARYRKVR